ncbi:MAG TPA: hypothetical protein VGE38_09895 [Nocardioides sp.]|uniref:hypothetical protein n=1 Tax=Nocardioides sp. TaxID=35761 RepID=UPI002ED9713D
MTEERTIKDGFSDAIGTLLGSIERANTSPDALRYAQALNEVAEAWAWVTSPAQPHGGNARAL